MKLKVKNEKLKIREWVSYLSEKMALMLYVHPQRYHVCYYVLIKNLLTKPNQVSVIMPVPLETEYQKISKLEFKIKNSKFKSDSLVPKVVREDTKFGNSYVVWNLKLRAGEQVILKEEFEAWVSPRDKGKISDQSIGLSCYFEPNKFLPFDDHQINKLAKQIIGRETGEWQQVKLLNQWVIDHLEYGQPITGLYTAKQALEGKLVDCGGFDSLLVSLCLATGIPSRIVSGFWTGYEDNQMHAWVEIYMAGQWVPADPSIEHLRAHHRTRKSAKLGYVGSDRIAMSVGCEIPIIVQNSKFKIQSFKVDILQHPFVGAEGGKNSMEWKTEFETKKLSR